MDLRALDLNLLVSLDALLEERNVTRAAARLHRSQPAMSAQLARLRSVFGDPLLMPAGKGRGMVATARALALQAPLRALLMDMAALVKTRPDFDPHKDTRSFCLACSDNGMVSVGLPLIEALRREAGGGIRLAFRLSDAGRIEQQLERGEVDLLIGSERMVPASMKAMKLLDERFVMAQRKGHPRGCAPLDLDTYCNDLTHVLVSTSGGSFEGFVDEQLAAMNGGAPGRRRQVVLSVQQFVLAPAILQATDHVCTLPSRMVARYADTLDAFELPFEAQGFSLSLAWHPREHDNPASRWLRDRVRAAVAPVPEPAPAKPTPANRARGRPR